MSIRQRPFRLTLRCSLVLIPGGKRCPISIPCPLNFIEWKIKIMQQLIAELKVKLIDILNLQDVSPEKFDENAQLVGGELGIDSIDVLEMVVMVEKDYGIVIKNQEVGEKER